MTSYKPQVGDIVSYQGPVTFVGPDYVYIDDEFTLDWDQITLVERPKPKVSVEIDFDTINIICKAAAEAWDGEGYIAACELRSQIEEALNERS